MLHELSAEIAGFIRSKQLQFEPTGNGVSDMLRIGVFVRQNRHFWKDLDFPLGKLFVQTLRQHAPQIVLIGVPPDMAIPIHSHGVGVTGVSGLLTGELFEITYALDGLRLQQRLAHRMTDRQDISIQKAGFVHAVCNMEKGDPAILIECWNPALNFKKHFRQRTATAA